MSSNAGIARIVTIVPDASAESSERPAESLQAEAAPIARWTLGLRARAEAFPATVPNPLTSLNLALFRRSS